MSKRDIRKILFTDSKPLSENCVYLDMTTDIYKDLRRLKDKGVYENIDFFETEHREGDFSYSNVASLSGIKADYTPLAASDDLEISYGTAPSSGQVVITRALAETLKSKLRLDELDNDRSLLLMLFEDDYRICGICEGDEAEVYFTKVDYVNFLGVYNKVTFSDSRGLFFEEDYVENTLTMELCLADESEELGNDEVLLYVNRNSLYKMMSDVTMADYRADSANNYLSVTSGGKATAIYIENSKPMYVQEIEITRDDMSTDVKVYVNSSALDDIFAYIAPDLTSLSSASSTAQYFFQVNASDEEQLANLKKVLFDYGIDEADVAAIYAEASSDELSEASTTLIMAAVVIALMLCIYFFIEKSASIKDIKEYGVYRAIGVNKSNLLFKETLIAVVGNVLPFCLYNFITAGLICGYYAVMNAAFGGFVGLALAFCAAGALLMTGISLLPHLFVLWRTPAKILSSYDI